VPTQHYVTDTDTQLFQMILHVLTMIMFSRLLTTTGNSTYCMLMLRRRWRHWRGK